MEVAAWSGDGLRQRRSVPAELRRSAVAGAPLRLRPNREWLGYAPPRTARLGEGERTAEEEEERASRSGLARIAPGAVHESDERVDDALRVVQATPAEAASSAKV